jgi:hypothetical protein
MIAKGIAGYLYTICRNSALAPANVISEPVVEPITSGDMKYEQTVTLSAGVETIITTTLTEEQEPYSVMFMDSDGKIITTDISDPLLEIVSGVWQITVYSSEYIYNAKLKIIY